MSLYILPRSFSLFLRPALPLCKRMTPRWKEECSVEKESRHED